jgi:acetyl esterase/lipase
MFHRLSRIACCLSLLACCGFLEVASAGPLRDRLKERRKRKSEQPPGKDEGRKDPGKVSLPDGVRLVQDVPYGEDDKQRMDVYLPPQAAGAPVLLMVHGGGWKKGDKGASAVVQNKMVRWVPKGFILISVNYRFLPDADPVAQAGDVARALAAAQGKAESWGGDPGKFILMGHSAGAHLCALLTASPAKAFDAGAKPWLGTVLLDSATYDVPKTMEGKHLRLYDEPFGKDPEYWRAASPFHQLSGKALPFLAVCSSRREDSIQQAEQFVTQATSLGVKGSLLKQDLSHGEINEQLGLEGAYTDAVEAFMAGIDEAVKRALGTHPSEP